MSVTIPVGYGFGVQQFFCSGVADPMVITCGFDGTSIVSAELVADVFRAGLTAGLLPSTAFPPTWTFGPTIGYYRSAPTVLEVFENPAVVVGGAPALQTLPPNVSVLYRKRTGIAGRTNRGRFYMPPFGLAESSVDQAGVIAPLDYGTLQDNADTMMSTWAGLDAHPVVLHSDPVLTPTEVTSLNVDQLVATQRRRIR